MVDGGDSAIFLTAKEYNLLVAMRDAKAKNYEYGYSLQDGCSGYFHTSYQGLYSTKKPTTNLEGLPGECSPASVLEQLYQLYPSYPEPEREEEEAEFWD